MSEAVPPKGWKVEYAKSGRSGCKSCGNLIAKDSLRIAKVVQSSQFDGFMTIWQHAHCILNKRGRFKSLDDVEGVDDLRWEDSKKLRKYVDTGAAKKDINEAAEEPQEENGVETMQSRMQKAPVRLAKAAMKKLLKERCNSLSTVRISTMVSTEAGRFRGMVPAWRHAKCFMDLGWLGTSVKELPGWDTLSREDQKEVQALDKHTSKNSRTGKSGSKRKATADQEETAISSSEKKPRKSKASERASARDGKSKVSSRKGKDSTAAASEDKPSELEKKMEKQSKDLWALKDELEEHVTAAEFRTMLAANGMDVTGTEQALRNRCADGMMFGALGNCPQCQSPLEYSDGQYKCKGFLTAWSKCSYASLKPDRRAGKWKVPSEIENDFLDKWNKKQKAKKAERLILPPASPAKVGELPHPRKASPRRGSPSGPLGGCHIAIIGRLSKPQAACRRLIEEAGGIVSKVSEDTYCVLTSESEIERQKDKLQHAQSLNIPIVKDDYLFDCIEQQTRLALDSYLLETGLLEDTRVKVKVKGRSAVHEDSELQDTGHILEVDKVIYNATLNLSDLSTGINSYYILQIIEDDHKNVHHLFRKWGRVGNSRIGSQKPEKLGKVKAISEFRRLLEEKTGNSWEDWENKVDLEKKPGKFYLVDIDFGIDDLAHKNPPVPAGSKSKLDGRVMNLMKLLFDVETYRAAMMEFEINMKEMPLGKLSKRHIERGFQVLTEIQNLIEGTAAQKEGLLVDASNQFFTLIPSTHPNIIRDNRLLKSKIDMLESLRDIEIASELIGSVGDSDEDPLDIHYGKLHCGISPVQHDSDDFKLVKKYLEKTHASTHKDWQLELEDVFEVDREGEGDAFAPFKGMDNRMLLWHGSRLTNFVGILSQGLRIAPPEAPATGYMFGKGLYFADLVSKSAQYCYTSKKPPTGLLMLCEVALGKSKEFKDAKYMEKPMRGTHSTKGVGKTTPLKSEFETWDDNVTVPCGKPVSSGPSDSSLQYNEYIVYDPAQVQLRFLLRVHFKHRR